jgi:hypothetical protein
MTDSAASDIRRAIRRLVFATVALAVVLVAAIVLVWVDSSNKRTSLRDAQRGLLANQADLRRDEVQTTRTLCTFRDDLDQRVRSTQDYLATHQQHVIFGVPRATIVTNLHNQERTLASLSGLHC